MEKGAPHIKWHILLHAKSGIHVKSVLSRDMCYQEVNILGPVFETKYNFFNLSPPVAQVGKPTTYVLLFFEKYLPKSCRFETIHLIK